MFNFFRSSNKKALISFRNYKKKGLISYKDLCDLPIGETLDLFPERLGAIVFKKIQKYPLKFIVYMEAGEEWKDHFHDCWELIHVIYGELNDKISNKKASPFKILRFSKGQRHIVESKSKSMFHVTFFKYSFFSWIYKKFEI